MICVYCDQETGDEFDEHEECVALALEHALDGEDVDDQALDPD